MLRRQSVTISGASSESCTGYTDAVVNGFLVGVQFTTGLATDSTSTGLLGTTGKIALTGAETGMAYWASATGVTAPGYFFPVCQLSSSSGGILGDSTAPLVGFFPVIEERIKVETSGGTSSAPFRFFCHLITQGA